MKQVHDRHPTGFSHGSLKKSMLGLRLTKYSISNKCSNKKFGIWNDFLENSQNTMIALEDKFSYFGKKMYMLEI